VCVLARRKEGRMEGLPTWSIGERNRTYGNELTPEAASKVPLELARNEIKDLKKKVEQQARQIREYNMKLWNFEQKEENLRERERELQDQVVQWSRMPSDGELLRAAELNRREEELRKRAAELNRREEELRRYVEEVRVGVEVSMREGDVVERARKEDALRVRAEELGKWADERGKKEDELGKKEDELWRYVEAVKMVEEEVRRRADELGREAPPHQVEDGYGDQVDEYY